jgi:hypothetical protein
MPCYLLFVEAIEYSINLTYLSHIMQSSINLTYLKEQINNLLGWQLGSYS